jgi:hypothetical protein
METSAEGEGISLSFVPTESVGDKMSGVKPKNRAQACDGVCPNVIFL